MLLYTASIIRKQEVWSFPFYYLVGEVKEKSKARKEYKEAVARGDGAYLMEEETPVSISEDYYILRQLVL